MQDQVETVNKAEIKCPYNCGNPTTGFDNVIQHLHMAHGFSIRKAETFLRDGGLPRKVRTEQASDARKLTVLKEQTGGKTFRCVDCDFETGATTYSGIKQALARHRQKFPAHRRLRRIEPNASKGRD